jgi:hypothetical protein
MSTVYKLQILEHILKAALWFLPKTGILRPERIPASIIVWDHPQGSVVLVRLLVNKHQPKSVFLPAEAKILAVYRMHLHMLRPKPNYLLTLSEVYHVSTTLKGIFDL